MKKTGAALARHALEQLGVTHTFGIPGVHNTELYDELNASEQIQPVLVAHECGAAFIIGIGGWNPPPSLMTSLQEKSIAASIVLPSMTKG